MAWPTPQDYNEAVQNPRLSFTDPELRAGQAELNNIGLPRPIAGGFACVYKIQSGGNIWAARCFLSEVTDQQQRYEAISKHLAAAKLPHTVPFSYLTGGIKVHERTYPLVKMQWVQGESLSTFVGRCVGYPDTLLSLAKVWSQLLADLKAASIAHGDLQHGNVVVVGDQLRLLDYDGMFVPCLAGKQSNEVGHRNYQLPTRTQWDYGSHVDNFAAWVIYVSLVALAVHPELWTRHRGGDECLIFRKADFEHPENSDLLRDLNSSPNAQLRVLVELFVSLFSLSPQDIPSLDGNLTKVTDASSPRPFSPQSVANWWSDHVDSASQTVERFAEPPVAEEDPVVVDPGWILDSMMDTAAVEPLVFRGQVKDVRIIMAGSLALIALTNLLAVIPATQVAVATPCIFGLNLLLCYVRFKRDPCQAEVEAFKVESKAFARRVQAHQLLIASISAERLALQEKLAAMEREIGGQKTRLFAFSQKEQKAAQAKLDTQLTTVNQRRRETSASESIKLNSIQGTLGNQISDLTRRIIGLRQKEVEETNTAQDALLKNHVQSYLRSHSVRGSSIPGIGESYMARLAYSGFTTAADIDWSVSRIHGIGPTRTAALIRWKERLENEARRSAPTLSQQDRLRIETKYRQECMTLESAKQQLQVQFNNQVTSTKQYFAGVRQSHNDEEQQLRAAWAQRKGLILQEQNAEITKLDQKLNAARNQVALAMTELSQKLRQTQKQAFGLRWQTAKKEKEGRRFACLGFKHYLHKVITP